MTFATNSMRFALLSFAALALIIGIAFLMHPSVASACEPYDECWGGGIVEVGGCGGYEDCYWVYMEGYYNSYSEGYYPPEAYAEGYYPPQAYSEGYYPPQAYSEGYYPPQAYSEGYYPPQAYSEGYYNAQAYSEGYYNAQGYGEGYYDSYSEGYYDSGGGGGGSPAVNVALVATPSSVSAGGTSVLTWTSSNATYCTSNFFNGHGATSNGTGITVGPLTGSGPWPYQINCYGAGAPGSDSKTITLSSGTPYILTVPSRVTAGQSSNISWGATGLPANTVCSMTRNGSAWAPSGGSFTANSSGVLATTSPAIVESNILHPVIYKLTCNSIPYTAIVNVNGQIQQY